MSDPQAPAWLRASWGKFKCAQRTLPAGQQLTRSQLSAAWDLWAFLKRETRGDAAEFAGSAASYMREREGDDDALIGCRVFASWLARNRDKLEAGQVRSVAETAHTTDKVSVQLISD